MPRHALANAIPGYSAYDLSRAPVDRTTEPRRPALRAAPMANASAGAGATQAVDASGSSLAARLAACGTLIERLAILEEAGRLSPRRQGPVVPFPEPVVDLPVEAIRETLDFTRGDR